MTSPLGLTTWVPLPPSLEELIRHLPALEALSASGRRLIALIEPELAALLRLTSIPVEPMPRLAESSQIQALVRSAGCDEAVVLSGRAGDAWLARSAGVASGWAYSASWAGWLLSHRARRSPRRTRARRPATEDSRELLAAMGVPWRTSVPRLTVDEQKSQTAQQRLERAHIRLNDRPLVGLYPGIFGGGADRPWPRVRFEELVGQLRRREPKTQCVILATTQDLWRAVRLHEETGKIHPVIGPDLTIDALAATLSELDLVVAVESSMLDLAAAVGTPTVGLHLREPHRWGPPGKRHIALHAGRAGTLGGIPVSRVLEAITPGPKQA